MHFRTARKQAALPRIERGKLPHTIESPEGDNDVAGEEIEREEELVADLLTGQELKATVQELIVQRMIRVLAGNYHFFRWKVSVTTYRSVSGGVSHLQPSLPPVLTYVRMEKASARLRGLVSPRLRLRAFAVLDVRSEPARVSR